MTEHRFSVSRLHACLPSINLTQKVQSEETESHSSLGHSSENQKQVTHFKIYISIHPFIHPSILSSLTRAGSRRQQVQYCSPYVPLPNLVLQLLLGILRHSQARRDIKPLQYILGLSRGLLPVRRAYEISNRRPPGGILMIQNHVNTKEQRLCSELPPDVHTLSEAELGLPKKEAKFSCLWLKVTTKTTTLTRKRPQMTWVSRNIHNT